MLLSDDQWRTIDQLPEVGRAHPVGRRPTDDRQVLEAVLWVMRHQARWQDLPSDYPSPRTCQRRLRHWQEAGCWEVIWDSYVDHHDQQELEEWGEVLINVLLAESRDERGNAMGKTRIGRPPFWRPMAYRFWRRTWDAQPEGSRRKLLEHTDFSPNGKATSDEDHDDHGND